MWSGGARFVACAIKTAGAVSPSNGNLPLSAWYITMPSEYTSLRPSRSAPETCSGTHVVKRSEHEPRLRHSRRVGLAGDAEIAHQRAAGLTIQQNVLGLDVAMHDAACMSIR